MDLSDPGIELGSSSLQVDSLPTELSGKCIKTLLRTHPTGAATVAAASLQSCLTLCDPIDYIVHGILQARILEWVAVPFSGGSSQPRDPTQVSHIVGRFFTS